MSPETREKLLAANTGRTPSPEARANMSAAAKGRKHSPESRAKISASNKGRRNSPETIAKMRDDLTGMIKGKWHVIEYAGRRRGSTMYKCFCECNPTTFHLIQACHLVSGASTQCRSCSYKELSINALQSEGRVRGLNKILSNAKHQLTDAQVVLMPFIGETTKANCKECGEVPARRHRNGKPKCYMAGVRGGVRVRYKNQAWQMLVSQLELRQGMCANPRCSNPILFGEGLGKSCHLDHDDKTGYICGWLCPTCNPGIGCFGHDPNRIEGAAEYVRQTRVHLPLPTPVKPGQHLTLDRYKKMLLYASAASVTMPVPESDFNPFAPNLT
jgi:hypothetical protein